VIAKEIDMRRIARIVLVASVVLWSRAAAAQLPADWTSTDVGSVGVAGSATESNGTWNVQGSGADIWGTSDSFQFVHKTMGASGRVEARVSDLQNTNPFAKVGVMVRAGLGPDAATVILDVRPGTSNLGFGGPFANRRIDGLPVGREQHPEADIAAAHLARQPRCRPGLS
jgi:hypothetical protein